MRCLGVIACVGLGVGCSFVSGAAPGTTPGDGNNSPSDGRAGGSDAATIPIDGCVSFASLLDTCSLGSGGTISLDDFQYYLYDTDEHALYVATSSGAIFEPVPLSSPHQTVDNNTLDVWVVKSFTLPSGVTLFLRGGLPFGIISSGDVTIAGTIDLVDGAGSRSANTCGAAAGQNGSNSGSGGSGGGGGAFERAGGAGGAGNDDGPNASNPVAQPTAMIGGCPGGNGGQGSDNGGNGGSGGGGLYIASATAITVTGLIDAAGQGGKGGGQSGQNQGNAGGGGGGSGGLIWLEAPMTTVTGTLAANGGAGGEGSAGKQQGHDGANGTTDNSQASGGSGVNNGGNGGKGDSANNTATDGGDATSGGGGGGGVGYIIIAHSTSVTGTVTPTAVQ